MAFRITILRGVSISLLSVSQIFGVQVLNCFPQMKGWEMPLGNLSAFGKLNYERFNSVIYYFHLIRIELQVISFIWSRVSLLQPTAVETEWFKIQIPYSGYWLFAIMANILQNIFYCCAFNLKLAEFLVQCSVGDVQLFLLGSTQRNRTHVYPLY